MKTEVYRSADGCETSAHFGGRVTHVINLRTVIGVLFGLKVNGMSGVCVHLNYICGEVGQANLLMLYACQRSSTVGSNSNFLWNCQAN